MTQNQWKRLNTLQHYKVHGGHGQGWGQAPHLWISQGRNPASVTLSYQVPDGATVGLIPQLLNGGAVSQSLSQSCPSGESESRNPDMSNRSRELEAGSQESWPCCRLGLPLPCQRANQTSRLS